MQIDLHTHSQASDGRLTPTELVNRASDSGIEMLALTDHDGIDGLNEARQNAVKQGIQFINGIELSVSWNKCTIHIVGLNFSMDYRPLQEGIQQLQEFRAVRAREIADKLEAVGIKGAYEG
ncbi:MAG: PHP domain-containing protein, partial [Gammaproteobacteria bacterium]|nr:PHP domain-containing protein [Gammaproteobacteria bacterium]